MHLQALIIGLGQFGMSVAQSLSARGAEVLAVDSDPARVNLAAEFVTEASCFDATDQRLLEETNPGHRDVCLCAIGDHSKEASIICTVLLKQLGARRLVARANNSVHMRILQLVGADLVVNPEREFGERIASQLYYEDVKGELLLGGNVVIMEVKSPASFAQHTLAELELPKRHGIQIAAIRRNNGSVIAPSAELRVAADDTLVLVGEKGSIASLLEKTHKQRGRG